MTDRSPNGRNDGLVIDVLIVAGLSLRNLHPRVWDPTSPFYIPSLKAVMVSYGEFHQMPSHRAAAMDQGLRKFLNVPEGVAIYLDNGAFHFAIQEKDAPLRKYEQFVEKALPDWKPIPQDYIPFPSMSPQKQRGCFDRTMRVNLDYQHNGYVPVVHIGNHLQNFLAAVKADARLAKKPWIALGAIVPNLLRKPKAMPYGDVLVGLRSMRRTFKKKAIHVFGVGGTATLHLTALLGFDSADSSGWRNRAARGIIQLPGSGERLIANLGSWRGRRPSRTERKALEDCACPACKVHGIAGLRAKKLHGFCCRATHNLWILLEENAWIENEIANGTYLTNYEARIDNSTYRPIIDDLLKLIRRDKRQVPVVVTK